jgi:hypothetical protein
MVPLLKLYPVTFRLDIEDLHAIPQNPHRTSSSDSLLVLPVSEELSFSSGFPFFFAWYLRCELTTKHQSWVVFQRPRCKTYKFCLSDPLCMWIKPWNNDICSYNTIKCAKITITAQRNVFPDNNARRTLVCPTAFTYTHAHARTRARAHTHTLVLRLPVMAKSDALCCDWRHSAGKSLRNPN